jgi:hypothetical protein
MKRIEMIDEIMCCLLAHSVTYPQFPLDNLKLAAEEILKMQEEKGMLPPETEIQQDDDDVRRNGVSYTGSYLVNAWDEE